MPKRINALITSAGVASAVNVIKSLRLQEEFDVSLVAIDMDPMAAGLHLADHHYVSPPIRDPEEYLGFLRDLCTRHRVSVLYPCYSRELSLVSQARESFSSLGVQMLVPPPEVIDLCNSKQHMAQLVSELGIPTPACVLDPGPSDLPLFSKLDEGSSSTGALVVDDAHMLNHLLVSGESRIYQDYVQGTEYTVDALCDRQSRLLFAGPRIRLATKSGQSVKAITVHNKALSDYVERICAAVGVVGVCNLQFIERDGSFHFIELNPRYAAGGLMLTVHAGANLPLVAAKLMLGLPIDASELRHEPNTVMTRYWEEIILREHTCD